MKLFRVRTVWLSGNERLGMDLSVGCGTLAFCEEIPRKKE